MHTRRLSCFLLGAWLIASVLLDFSVIQNFRAVDRFLAAPDGAAADQIHTMGGKPAARTFLRHEVGELNAYLFESWQSAELILGVALLLVLLFGQGDPSRVSLLFTVLMLAIAATTRFWLTPEIARLGRLIDYPGTPGADAGLFWQLHGVSSGLEVLKLLLGFVVAANLLMRTTDRKKFVREQASISRAGAQQPRG